LLREIALAQLLNLLMKGLVPLLDLGKELLVPGDQEAPRRDHLLIDQGLEAAELDDVAGLVGEGAIAQRRLVEGVVGDQAGRADEQNGRREPGRDSQAEARRRLAVGPAHAGRSPMSSFQMSGCAAM